MASWRRLLARQRRRADLLVDSRPFVRVVVGLILVNAAVLGAETFPEVMARHGSWLRALDRAILALFVVELSLRIFAKGRRFFGDPWSLFDAAIVAVSLVPANEAFAILRAMRVLRVLRLISAFPQLRRVLQGLLGAIPGLGAITGLLLIFLYVFAVVSAKLFGEQYPQWFGGLHVSLFTLFQIMTLEGWVEIVRTVKETHPWAWMLFIAFILLSTFTVLNLFIAVIVDTMQKTKSEERPVERQLAEIRREIVGLGRRLEAIAAREAS